MIRVSGRIISKLPLFLAVPQTFQLHFLPIVLHFCAVLFMCPSHE